jgi:branched-chain amino acid transport system permease protein
MTRNQRICFAVFFLLMIPVPWLLGPFMTQIVILVITSGMLALAFTHTLKCGLLRFDIAGWWAVGGYTTAVLTTKYGVSFWLSMLIGGLIAVAIGYLIFIVAIPRGMIAFFMVGMVVAMIITQVFSASEYFGGWGGIANIPPPSIGSFQFISKPSLYYLGLALLALQLFVLLLLYNSRIGRAWSAIGGGLKLAKSLGIDIVKYRMVNVLVGNFFLALLGSYYAAYSLSVSPMSFSTGVSINVMVAVLIGGMFHSISAPFIGSAILYFIPEYLRSTGEFSSIILALITIFIILFMPMGLLGLFDRWVMPLIFRLTKRYPPGMQPA